MIEQQITYKVTFTENQLRELRNLLQREKDIGQLTHDNDLLLVLNELKTIFTGVR